jgi:hypothetical protein
VLEGQKSMEQQREPRTNLDFGRNTTLHIHRFPSKRARPTLDGNLRLFLPFFVFFFVFLFHQYPANHLYSFVIGPDNGVNFAAAGLSRYQVSGSAVTYLWRCCHKIVATDGVIKGLFLPGLSSNVAAVRKGAKPLNSSVFFSLGILCPFQVGLCSAIRFALYPRVRTELSRVTSAETEDFITSLGAGLITGAMSYSALAPLYLEKTRSQGVSAKAGGDSHICARSFMRSLCDRMAGPGGVAGLWHGSSVLVVRGAALSVGQVRITNLTAGGPSLQLLVANT